MKTELIEYHRDKVRNYEGLAFAKHGIRPEVRERYKERHAFHERAVAWLESMESYTRKGYRPVSPEEAVKAGFVYPVLTAEQAEAEMKRFDSR